MFCVYFFAFGAVGLESYKLELQVMRRIRWQEVCHLFCPQCEQLRAVEGSDVSVYDWRCAEGRRQPQWKVKGLVGHTPRAVLNRFAG